MFGHFESWAYAWALVFPTAVGIGMVIQGQWSGDPRVVEHGVGWARVGIVIFLVGLLFFELVLDIGGFTRGFVGRIFLPALLIAVGAYMLVGRRDLSPSPRADPRESSERPAAEMPGGQGTAASG